ncbi:MAG: serine hydrolase domain-containing protein [Bacteroidota bacterium]
MTRFLRYTFLFSCYLFFTLSVAAQPASKNGFSSTRMDLLGSFIDSEIEDQKLHGGVCLIQRKGKEVYRNTYGYSDLARKKRMQEDHIFYIQSMTKPIISIAFMMLYEEGHFLLSDPIEKYLPQFKDMKVAKDPGAGLESAMENANGSITIAQLLSHQAGLSHGLGSSKLDKTYFKELYLTQHADIEARVNVLAQMPLVGQPGEQWYYSASPDVLALLIEKFSGMTTADFLQKRLFDPLGMKDTGYNLPKNKQARVVAVHGFDKEGKIVKNERQVPMEGNTIFGGTHGLFSTAADYMVFCQMLLNKGEWQGKRYISRKTLELMTTDHTKGKHPDDGIGFGLGFGVRINQTAELLPGSIGQFYWSGAFNTYFFIDPQEEMIAILMMQLTPYTDYYKKKFRQFVYQSIVD